MITFDKKELVLAALAAQTNAYAPYSGYLVGAAAYDDNGRMFTGCNIENASYGATVCAERTAVFKAVSDGAKKIKMLAVTVRGEEFARPCGICRQVIVEFAAEDFVLLSANGRGEFIEKTMNDLLPEAFSPRELEEGGV
jgi:cytidine deaminase